MAISFGVNYTPVPGETRKLLFEMERSTAAFDGRRIVGTAGIYSYQMTVPGERTVPCAGVTRVSVLPSHRRQGVLTLMMRDQLERAKAHGDVVAALWASESIIYGRFGYGIAADGLLLSIERAHSQLAFLPPTNGRVRYTTPSDARESWPAVYDALRIRRPGWMTRSANWWSERVFSDRPENRGGATEAQYVQYEVDGELQGYMRYRKKLEMVDRISTGSTIVEELVALTDEAYAALWQFTFGLDLVAKIEADHRPADEPLRYMLADPRRLLRRPGDSLWVRILDVERALAARAYAGMGEVVFDVSDAFLPGVGGRFLLTVTEAGVTCGRTDRTADVSLGISELSAAYLSGVPFTTLARAGLVRGSADAVSRVDALFAWPVAPWIPENF